MALERVHLEKVCVWMTCLRLSSVVCYRVYKDFVVICICWSIVLDCKIGKTKCRCLCFTFSLQFLAGFQATFLDYLAQKVC